MLKERKPDTVNKEKNFKIGYTAGVYDLFHIGHLNLLRKAKEMCDVLVVGVTTDELACYKNVVPFICEEERMEIVRSIRYVDAVVSQVDLDKVKAWEKIRFDVIFVGSDWKDSPEWNSYENRLNSRGAQVIYIPYTEKTSSTKLREVLNNALSEKPIRS